MPAKSETTRKVNPLGMSMKTVHLMPKRDKALLLAKLCAAKGKTESAKRMAKFVIDSDMMNYGHCRKQYSTGYETAAMLAKEYGFTEEAEKAAITIFTKHLSKGHHKAAARAAKKYGLTEEQMKDAAHTAIRECCMWGHNREALQIAKDYGMEEEIPKIALRWESSAICNLDFSKAEEISSEHGLTEAQVREAAASAIKHHMERKQDESAEKIATHYNLPEKAAEAAARIVEWRIEHNDYWRAAELAKKHGLHEKAAEAAAHIVEHFMKRKEYGYAAKIAKEHGLDKKAEEAAAKSVEKLMETGEYLKAAELADEYGFAEKREEAVSRAVDWHMRNNPGYWGAVGAAQIANEHGLQEKAAEFAAIAVEKSIGAGHYDAAGEFASKYGFTEGQVLEIAAKVISYCLENKDYLRAAHAAKNYGFMETMEAAAAKAINLLLGSAEYKKAAEAAAQYGFTELEKEISAIQEALKQD